MTTVSELEVLINGNKGDLTTKLDQADRELDGFAQKAEGHGKAIALGIGAAVAAAGVAVAKYSLEASIAFESQFADVRKTVDATEEEFTQLRNTLRDMATDTENPLSALSGAHETLTQIMALGGQLGIATDNLDEFTETVGAMTVATNLGAEQAATFLARFANVTGIDADQFRDVGNAIVELGNNMATTEDQIATFATRIAPLANYGFDPADILGLSGALSSLGVSAELGGTNLLKTVGAITEAVATGDDLEAFAEAAGMTADEFKNLNESDPSGSFLAFVEGLSEMDASEQILTLKNLGITSQEQISLLQRMAGGFDTVTEGMELANDAMIDSNALMEEAAAKADTTQGKINVLKNRFYDLGITIGDKLRPHFNAVLDALINITGGLNNLISGNVDFGTFGENIKAGLLGAIQNLLSGLGVDVDLSGVTSSVSSALANALNAVGVDPSAISTLGATTWSSISSAFDAANVDFSSVTTTVGDALALAITDVQNVEVDTTGITTFAEGHFTDIVDLVGIAAGVVFGGPIGLAIGAGKLLAGAIESDFLGLGTFLDTTGIGAEVERVAGEIKRVVEDAFNSIFGGGDKGILDDTPLWSEGLPIGRPDAKEMGMFDTLVTIGSKLKSDWDTYFAPIVDAVKDAFAQDIGPGLSKLGSGIKEFTDIIGDIEIPEYVLTSFRDLLNIAIRIGGMFVGGVLEGVGEGLPEIGGGISEVYGGFVSLGQGDIKTGLGGIADGLLDISGGLLSIPVGVIDSVIDLVNKLTGWEIPDIRTGIAAWGENLETLGTIAETVFARVKSVIEEWILDTKIRLLEFVQDLVNVANNIPGVELPISGLDIEFQLSELRNEKYFKDAASDIKTALQEQINSGEIDISPTANLAGINLIRGGQVDENVVAAMGAEGVDLVNEALGMALAEGDGLDIGRLLHLADLQGTDLTQFQEEFAALLPTLFAGINTEGEGQYLIDLAGMVGMDPTTVQQKLQEGINKAAGAGMNDTPMEGGEGGFSASLDVVADLSTDELYMYQQLEDSVVAAASSGVPVVTLSVDVVVTPNSVDMSAINTVAAGGGMWGGGEPTPVVGDSRIGDVPAMHTGGTFYSPRGEGFAFLRSGETVRTAAQEQALNERGSGGNYTYVINSYGQNPYGVNRMIQRAERDRGK